MFLFWGGIVTIVANASKWTLFGVKIDLLLFCRSRWSEFYFAKKYICHFAVSGGLLGGFARQLALRDGRISCAEVFSIIIFIFSETWSQGCCLGLLGCFTGMASLLEVVTLIWVRSLCSWKITTFSLFFAFQKPKSLLQGSVVVFSSWPNWTSEDMTSPDYCMETPMLFAFVLQIVRWVGGTLIFKLSDGRNYFQGFDRDLHHPWLFCLLLGMLQGAISTHISNHGSTLKIWMHECFEFTLKSHPFLSKPMLNLISRWSGIKMVFLACPCCHGTGSSRAGAFEDPIYSFSDQLHSFENQIFHVWW